MSKTYKQIEESRNRRLWITTVLIPLVSTAGMLYSNDTIRQRVDNTCNKLKWEFRTKKESIKSKFRKNKES